MKKSNRQQGQTLIETAIILIVLLLIVFGITEFARAWFTKNSLKTIGEHFGGRDHTTVIHSCQTVKDLMDTDSVFKENVLELTQKVQLAAL